MNTTGHIKEIEKSNQLRFFDILLFLIQRFKNITTALGSKKYAFNLAKCKKGKIMLTMIDRKWF